MTGTHWSLTFRRHSTAHSNNTQYLDDVITYLRQVVEKFDIHDSYNLNQATCSFNLAVALSYRCDHHDETGAIKEDIVEIISILSTTVYYRGKDSDIRQDIPGVLETAYFDHFVMLDESENSSESDDHHKANSWLRDSEKLQDGNLPPDLSLRFGEALTYRYERMRRQEDSDNVIKSLEKLNGDPTLKQRALIFLVRTYTPHFRISNVEISAESAYSCLENIEWHQDLPGCLYVLGFEHLQFYVEQEAVDLSLPNDIIKLSCLIDLSIARALDGGYDGTLAASCEVLTSLSSDGPDRSRGSIGFTGV
ncbi:hypothetical protein M422DRAFT_52409 [Sphaerobolus stellatus SS14]|uniref:Uncharacterized protein n=1 Tax=Sphaerobolus stellatus (strain SS14) TaxID=990650 RepID=A0A0C9UFC4_SPHS4|nr:hypothetical protein M422DRAFT_52409 [Sphaerobolus stellatus SS14]